AAPAQRDHLLRDRPHRLRLRLRRLDATVLDQRAREVRVERLAVGRVAAELLARAVVPHRPEAPPVGAVVRTYGLCPCVRLKRPVDTIAVIATARSSDGAG